MEFKVLPWEELHRRCFQLARQIEAEGTTYDVIVAAARGGLTISHIISDILSLPITSFTISSYDGIVQTEEPRITYPLSGNLKGKSILFVDDISDTGKTFVSGKKHLEEKGATNVKTASVFSKPWTTYMPDFSCDKTEAWVVFPYDGKETILALKKKFEAEGLNAEEIKSKLREIGLDSTYIDLYAS